MGRTDGEPLPDSDGVPTADFDDWDLRRHFGATAHEMAQARDAVGQHPEKLRYFLSDRGERLGVHA